MYWYCTAVFGSRFQSFHSKLASASSDNDNYDFLGRGYNIDQGSLKNEFHYLSPVLNDGKSENVIDSGNGRDIRDGEVRMDLTDDLLHMVLISFLLSVFCVVHDCFVLVVFPSPYSSPPCFLILFFMVKGLLFFGPYQSLSSRQGLQAMANCQCSWGFLEKIELWESKHIFGAMWELYILIINSQLIIYSLSGLIGFIFYWCFTCTLNASFLRSCSTALYLF